MVSSTIAFAWRVFHKIGTVCLAGTDYGWWGKYLHFSPRLMWRVYWGGINLGGGWDPVGTREGL